MIFILALGDSPSLSNIRANDSLCLPLLVRYVASQVAMSTKMSAMISDILAITATSARLRAQLQVMIDPVQILPTSIV